MELHCDIGRFVEKHSESDCRYGGADSQIGNQGVIKGGFQFARLNVAAAGGEM
jgi:hypothetical protein